MIHSKHTKAHKREVQRIPQQPTNV